MTDSEALVKEARRISESMVEAWQTALIAARFEAEDLRTSSRELALSAAVVATQANDAERTAGGIGKLAHCAIKALKTLGIEK